MRSSIVLAALATLALAAPAEAHLTNKHVRKDKRQVRSWIRAAQDSGAQSIGLGVDVRDPLNHRLVLSGSFIRSNGRRCVIRQATFVRHTRMASIDTCLGGIGGGLPVVEDARAAHSTSGHAAAKAWGLRKCASEILPYICRQTSVRASWAYYSPAEHVTAYTVTYKVFVLVVPGPTLHYCVRTVHGRVATARRYSCPS